MTLIFCWPEAELFLNSDAKSLSCSALVASSVRNCVVSLFCALVCVCVGPCVSCSYGSTAVKVQQQPPCPTGDVGKVSMRAGPTLTHLSEVQLLSPARAAVCLCVFVYARSWCEGNTGCVLTGATLSEADEVCAQRQSENEDFKVSPCVLSWDETCRWMCLHWEWFVYLAAPLAHLWECCHLPRGLEDLSIFNGVQTIPSRLFMHRFIHLLANSSFIHRFPTLSVISKLRPIWLPVLHPSLPNFQWKVASDSGKSSKEIFKTPKNRIVNIGGMWIDLTPAYSFLNLTCALVCVSVPLYYCKSVYVFSPLDSHCLMMAMTQIQQLFIPPVRSCHPHTRAEAPCARTHTRIHSSIQMSTLFQWKEPLHLSLAPDFSTKIHHCCARGENFSLR